MIENTINQPDTGLGIDSLIGRRDLLRVGSLSIAASALPLGLCAAEKQQPQVSQGKA